ncbi:MAG: hypothetical protein MnENMB40S_29990 [Rhizobiaceae bacterium MnEN-MB40S]|nr:MAG: hypothetical protein MnENMB40S_29990 [Rhizobiaceae bacterium MnEN-MB40S]
MMDPELVPMALIREGVHITKAEASIAGIRMLMLTVLIRGALGEFRRKRDDPKPKN